MSFRLRKVWLTFHRWLGLTAGLIFAFTGLTGSLIVFNQTLDEWLNSHMLLTTRQGEPLSLTKVIAIGAEQAPAPGRITNAFYPRQPNGVFTLYFREQEKSDKATTMEVFVDPISGEILGQRPRESGLMAIVYRLHVNLLNGDNGRTLLGGLSLLALVSLVSGLLLWWPLLRRGLRIGFGIRPRMFMYDLHKSVGGVFLPVLLLIVSTSVYLTLPGFVKPLVKIFSPETKLPGKLKSTVPHPKTAPIGPDGAVEIARREMPGCRPMSIELPQKADDSYRVFVRQVGEVGELRGVGRVWIDQYSGDCLGTRDWRKFTFADTYFRIQLALHSGDAFGIFGRWLVCIAGLAPTVLYVTGLITWIRRPKRRAPIHQNVERHTVTPPPPSHELVAAAGN